MESIRGKRKWEIIIIEAVLKSKLLYGLETAHLTLACLKRMNAFQMERLGQLLKFKHTYWDRAATNRALETAAEEAYRKRKFQTIERNQKRVIEQKTMIPTSKEKQLGHILRANIEDPMRQVTTKSNTATKNV